MTCSPSSGGVGPGARFLSLSTLAHGTGSFCVMREWSCLVRYRRKFSSILGLHALDARCNKQKTSPDLCPAWRGWGVASPLGENCCLRTFSNLRMHWTVLEGWLRDRLRGVTPRGADSWGLGRSPEAALSTGSQVLPLRLCRGAPLWELPRKHNLRRSGFRDAGVSEHGTEKRGDWSGVSCRGAALWVSRIWNKCVDSSKTQAIITSSKAVRRL